MHCYSHREKQLFWCGSDDLLTFLSSVYYYDFLKILYEGFNAKVDIYVIFYRGFCCRPRGLGSSLLLCVLVCWLLVVELLLAFLRVVVLGGAAAAGVLRS